MRRRYVSIVALFILALPTYLRAQSITGNQYLELSDRQKGWYFLGALDAMKMTRDLYFSRSNLDAAIFDKLWDACISGRPVRQHIAILDSWLSDNPHRWHEQVIVLIFDATKKSCAASIEEVSGESAKE